MKDKKGFTLIEVVLALGLTTIILQTVVFFMVDIGVFTSESKAQIRNLKQSTEIERHISVDVGASIDKEGIETIADVIEIKEGELNIHSVGESIQYKLEGQVVKRIEGVYVEEIIEGVDFIEFTYEEDLLKVKIEDKMGLQEITIKIPHEYWDYKKE